MNYQATLKFNQQDYTGSVCSTDHDAVWSAIDLLKSKGDCVTDRITLIVHSIYSNEKPVAYVTTLGKYFCEIA